MRRSIFIAVPLFLLLIISIPLYSVSGNEALSKFRSRMYSIGSMRGMITLQSNGGMMTGTFSYKAPGKIHIQFNDGKTIVSNGRKLWVYNPANGICGVQDLGGGGSGGIAAYVDSYSAIAPGNGNVIKLSGNNYYDEITVVTDDTGLLMSATFNSTTGGGFSISLSGVQVNLGLPGGMFDYSVPANAQLVKNPLNIQ